MQKNHTMKPKISVIICERNSEKFIEECIASVISQSFRDFELIIIDDFSTDKTKEKINKLKEKHEMNLIELKKHSGISFARNTGIKNSKGEFVAFLDSDAMAGKNWLQELLEAFDEKAASVGGPNILPENTGEKEKIFDELLEFISRIGSDYIKKSSKITEVKHNPGCNSMYRKKTLEEINGFNEKLSSNEDPELDFRIKKKGYKIKFNPNAVVYHHRKNSAKKIFNQAFWFGLGRMQAIKVNFRMIEWFRTVPAISIIIILLLFFFGVYSGKFELIVYFSFFLVLVLIMISLAAMIKYKRISLHYFIFLFSWFFGYGFGMIKGVFK